jgi:ABC-type phosphate transport system ATPase subunit
VSLHLYANEILGPIGPAGSGKTTLLKTLNRSLELIPGAKMTGTVLEELLRELRGQYTIVIVTHNMAQARRVSDECIFMPLGEKIEHRRTEDLFINPKDERTGRYVEGRYG